MENAYTAATYDHILAHEAVDHLASPLLLAAYCDPIVHTLPMETQDRLHRYTTMERIVDSVYHACTDHDMDYDDDAAVQYVLYHLKHPAHIAAHPHHYLLDRDSYGLEGTPGLSRERAVTTIWDARLHDYATQDPALAASFREIVQTDAPAARSAFAALTYDPTSSLTRDTIAIIQAQPLPTDLSRPYPCDDLTLAYLHQPDGDDAVAALTNGGRQRFPIDGKQITPAHLERLVRMDHKGHTTADILTRIGQAGSPDDIARLVTAALDTPLTDVAICDHPMWCSVRFAPALLHDVTYACALQQYDSDQFYRTAAHRGPDALTPEGQAATGAQAAQINTLTDQAWALVNGHTITETDLDCFPFDQYTSVDALFHHRPRAFFDHFGQGPIMQKILHCDTIDPHERRDYLRTIMPAGITFDEPTTAMLIDYSATCNNQEIQDLILLGLMGEKEEQ